MKKLAFTFISLFLLLASCQANDSDAITLVGQDNEHPIHGSDNENFTLPDGEELAVAISDIEKMNIGPEIPRLLYTDNNIVVMQGTFGVVVYNMQDSIVTNRISYEQIKSYDLPMMLASVSQDGKTIFIGNDDMSNEFIYTYKYNISTRVIKKTTQQPSNLFSPITIETPGYNEEYDKYFDLHYLTGDKIVEMDNSFIYLRSKDWNMKNLQIVICQYEDGENKVFDVFK
ncbi:hypothetical protein [Sporosarcina sp. E16_8]|uniref:hypothetical protein n=1 Tax=Sporosarcina sp. E16_8 TaxID=2789295 RepID=UPI001A935B3A|nr:hypothetical protein [Sporosarcina sp. E16_8]MBO0589498.1 hypothetical protein [Sporosarcina sp. E16_8]